METAVMQEESEGEEEEEEDPGITDIDEPTPIFIKPISSLPGTMYAAYIVLLCTGGRDAYGGVRERLWA